MLVIKGRIRQKWTVFTSSNCEATVEVVNKGPETCVEAERNPVRSDKSDQWNKNDQGRVEPVNVLVPVGPRHGEIGDVNFVLVDFDLGFGVASERDVVFRAVGEGGGVLCGGSWCRHGGGVASVLEDERLPIGNGCDGVVDETIPALSTSAREGVGGRTKCDGLGHERPLLRVERRVEE